MIILEAVLIFVFATAILTTAILVAQIHTDLGEVKGRLTWLVNNANADKRPCEKETK